ncbi:MAG: bifunctional metallophosphatase/5'-nucleotidase [Candidatus Krumholzibacteria bacterium]|nr:bifunctional metallophosphatase/5'-nucleotidase [Candidatus Krumholzibacteria bacterium]
MRSTGLAGLLFVTVLLSVCIGPGCSNDADKTDKKPAELTILFSNDLLGKIRSCGCVVEDTGGLGRRSTYIKRVRGKVSNLLVLDAGDAFGLDLGYSKEEAQLTFDAFDIMGLDVFTPGEMEFIFGLPFLQALAENVSFDIVAANVILRETGEPVFGKRYVIRELKGGLKVGITGVLDDAMRFPAYIDKSEFRIEPVEKVLRSVVRDMKKEADFFILISHMGIERTEGILEDIEDFDVALVGHGKPGIKGEVKVGKTLMLGTAGEGQYIGNMSLSLGSSGGYTYGRLRHVQLLSKNYELDRDIADLFLLYKLALTDKDVKKTGRSTAGK